MNIWLCRIAQRLIACCLLPACIGLPAGAQTVLTRCRQYTVPVLKEDCFTALERVRIDLPDN